MSRKINRESNRAPVSINWNAKNIPPTVDDIGYLFQRWVLQVEEQDVWLEQDGSRIGAVQARVETVAGLALATALGCLFWTRFKRTHNDKVLSCNPLSLSHSVSLTPILYRSHSLPLTLPHISCCCRSNQDRSLQERGESREN